VTLPANSYSITESFTPYRYSDSESHSVFLNAQGNTTFVSDNVSSPVNPATTGALTQDVEFNNLTIDSAQFTQANGVLYGQTLTDNGNITAVDDSSISITATTINGHGGFSMADAGLLSVSGQVASGVSFNVGPGGTLDVDNPSEFQGSINITPEHDSYDVLFQGITATSFNWNGSELVLTNGNKTVGSFKVTDQYGDGGLYAFQTSGGVVISDGQPTGGHAIPGHTLTA
jgi:hypothetical protein